MLQPRCCDAVPADEGGSVLESRKHSNCQLRFVSGKLRHKHTGCSKIRRKTQLSRCPGLHPVSRDILSPNFLCSYSSGSGAAATKLKAARWLPPTAPRWPNALWSSSGCCSLEPDGWRQSSSGATSPYHVHASLYGRPSSWAMTAGVRDSPNVICPFPGLVALG